MLPYYSLFRGAFPESREPPQERRDALHRCSNLSELAQCIQEMLGLDKVEVMRRILCHVSPSLPRNSHDLECVVCGQQTSDCVMLSPCGHTVCRSCIRHPEVAARLRVGSCIYDQCPVTLENYLDCGLFVFVDASSRSLDDMREGAAGGARADSAGGVSASASAPVPALVPSSALPPDVHHQNDRLRCPQNIQMGTCTFTDHKMLDASESILSHYRLATPETREALRLYSGLRQRGLVTMPHLKLLVTSEREEPGPRCRWEGRLGDLFAHLTACPYHAERCVCGFSHFRFIVEEIHAPNCPERLTECQVCGVGGIPQVRVFDHSVKCLRYNWELEKKVDRLENAVARFSTAIGKWSLSHQQSAMDRMVGMGSKEPRRRKFRINKTLYFYLKKLFFTHLLLVSVFYFLAVYLYQLLQKYFFPAAHRISSLVILALTSVVLVVASLVAIDTLIRQMGGRYVTRYMFEVYVGMMTLYGVQYGMIANVRSGAFVTIPDGTAQSANYVMLSLFYYSAVVISRFGFGDVAPTEVLGRLFVTTEAMWGIYLCIILFRGMSFFIQTTSLEDSLHAMISNFFTMAREVPSLIEALNEAPRKRAAALSVGDAGELPDGGGGGDGDGRGDGRGSGSGGGSARGNGNGGRPGSPGSLGFPGTSGASGDPGTPGTAGSAGLAGPTGPTGAQNSASGEISGPAGDISNASEPANPTGDPPRDPGRTLFIQAISHDDDDRAPPLSSRWDPAHRDAPRTLTGRPSYPDEANDPWANRGTESSVDEPTTEDVQAYLTEESIGSDVRLSRSGSQLSLGQFGTGAGRPGASSGVGGAGSLGGTGPLWRSVGEGLGLP